MFEWTSKWSRMPSLCISFNFHDVPCITDAPPNNFSFFFVKQFPRRKQTVYPFYRDFYGKFRGAPTCLYVLRIARKRTCARARSICSIGTNRDRTPGSLLFGAASQFSRALVKSIGPIGSHRKTVIVLPANPISVPKYRAFGRSCDSTVCLRFADKSSPRPRATSYL